MAAVAAAAGWLLAEERKISRRGAAAGEWSVRAGRDSHVMAACRGCHWEALAAREAVARVAIGAIYAVAVRVPLTEITPLGSMVNAAITQTTAAATAAMEASAAVAAGAAATNPITITEIIKVTQA
jgi:hypothetical protein